MSEKYLALKFKKTLKAMGIKRLILKNKIRIREHWTKEKGEEAKLEIRKIIYRSQY